MASVRVGDLGVTLQLTCQEGGSALDVSSATTKQIKLKRPDTSVVTYTASFVGDGTDGQIEATTATGTSDFAKPGTYQVYARLVIGSWDGHTDAVPLTVEKPGS